MKLAALLHTLPAHRITGSTDIEIRGIAYSSRDVRPGYLFAALKGEKQDGSAFVPEAWSRGAVAVLSERPAPQDLQGSWIQVEQARRALALISDLFFGRPSRRLKMVGVTGTKGKTTVTYLLESILQAAGHHPGVIGTISYRGPGLEMKAVRTTPEAPDIQAMLKRMLENGATHCVMEVSSHSLELDRVAGIAFTVAVFTNLSGEHLDYHHTMENYFAAKKKLFTLPPGNQTAVINADDPWGRKLAASLGHGCITFGFSDGSDVRPVAYACDTKGIRMRIRHPAGRMVLSSSLPGRTNASNILAAASVALALGIPDQRIAEGVSSLRSVPGRFEKIPNALGINVFVDYAHNDGALLNLLESFRELSPPRIILVFGAGGDRDRSKRPRMGEVAGTFSDYATPWPSSPTSKRG